MPGELQSGGKEPKGFYLGPAAVLVVPHQGISPGGDTGPGSGDSGRCTGGPGPDSLLRESKPGRTQLCLPGPLPRGRLTTKTLFFRLSFQRRSLPGAVNGGAAVDQGQISLFQGPIRYGFAQECGGRLRPGINHEAPHALVQPMDGENFPAQAAPSEPPARPSPSPSPALSGRRQYRGPGK